MQRDQDLFNKVADAIDHHPETYNQGVWLEFSPSCDRGGCDTKACLAGHGVTEAYFRGDLHKAFNSMIKEVSPHYKEDGASLGSVMVNGEPKAIQETAKELFGLTEFEASVLFAGEWQPYDSLTVPAALRLLGKNAPIEVVTQNHALEEQGVWIDEEELEELRERWL